MMVRRWFTATTLGVLLALGQAARADTILYDQDFENPTGFVNDGGDVNIFRSVNQLYGNQPPGFTFAQANTVETLLLTGTRAFGTGYSDPSGQGGNYALGMLSSFQNDLLGLSFDLGGLRYLNMRLDVSSIDLSVFSGPFVPIGGAVPVFQLTLYDNPGGATGLGSGAILDSIRIEGTASPRSVLDWTRHTFGLDAAQATNGKVTLRIDLLSGGYAAMDNFLIVGSNTEGVVPEPHAITLLGLGLAGLLAYHRRKAA